MVRITGKLVYLLLISVIILTLFYSFRGSSAEARSLQIIDVDIEAEVLPDGSMRVVENRTIDFKGTFSGADQKYYFTGGISYADIWVREGDQYYKYVEEFPTFEPQTYSVQSYYDYYILDWSFTAQNERRTFTHEYIVLDLVIAHEDVAELYYQFIGAEWYEPTMNARVTLYLPPGGSEKDVRAWGHGPLRGEVVLESPEKITWTVSPLKSNTFLEGRVVFPLELVPEVTRFSGKAALPAILSEEERLARYSNIERVARQYQVYYALFLFLPLGYALIRMRIKAAASKHAFKGKYYRELPGQYSPEVAGYLWHKKQFRNKFFAASILDLARRRWLRIEENPDNTREKDKKDDFSLVQLRSKTNDHEQPFDSQVMQFLFETVHGEMNPGSNDAEEGEKIPAEKAITFSQIRSFAQKKPREFHNFYVKYRTSIEKAGESHSFFKKRSPLNWGCLLLIMMLAASIVSFFWWGLYLLGGVLLLAPLLLFFASPKNYYTEYGADQLAKWRAFRRFLLHFSKMKSSTVSSLAIWEHYLVYAVILNVAKEVIEQLPIAFPNMESSPDFSSTSWSSFSTARGLAVTQDINKMTRSLDSTFDRASRTATRAIAAASRSSSSSSSSGGFSSGSGFGGGFSRGGGGGSGGGGGRFR